MTTSNQAEQIMTGGQPEDNQSPPSAQHASMPPGFVRSIVMQLQEGSRSCALLAPRWSKIYTSPLRVAFLVALFLLVEVATQRLVISGQIDFYWQALAGEGLGLGLLAWLAYFLNDKHNKHHKEPGYEQIFSVLVAQAIWLSFWFGLALIVLVHSGKYEEASNLLWMQWSVILVPSAWTIISELVLFWHASKPRWGALLVALLLLVGNEALSISTNNTGFWIQREDTVEGLEEEEQETLDLTQELMEAQPVLLAARLAEIKPQRPGVIDLYGITFAPFSEVEVFRNESAMVSEVMAKRFDANGRVLQLVNHNDTVEELPWATPLNLKRAIFSIAQRMDKNEDILFLHLTSHGASDGKLAASFPPMTVEEVTPDQLRSWLDEAGIKHRVISISACFAGNWVAPLANNDSLVMTASDADHTSYGCGKKSPLTFFGRAMYGEQLRDQTLSFETAHAAARIIIKKREEEAGKDDGYSNPQIQMGDAMRLYLALLQDRLQKQK
ncbi:MAG: C13 family peptidase [Burkholderiaceae bacterium]|nr:C13 family peptidase [Burkholderiaceae bacterium]